MKLIKHKLIDGIQVFIGVEKPAIDTKAAIDSANALIAEIPEQVEFNNKIKEGKKNARDALKHKRNFMGAYNNVVQQMKAEQADVVIIRDVVLARMTPADLKKLIADEVLYNSYLAANKIVENHLTEIGGRLKVKSKEIRRANPVYCNYEGHPEKMMVEDSRAESLATAQAGKSKHEQIDIDGTVIDDFRGCVCHHKDGSDKWIKTTIDELGLKPTFEIMEADLTDEQRAEIHAQNETERITGLSAEDKEAELAGMISGAMAQSVNMRSELEILGDADALTKSQEFYQGEVTRLEVVYG